MTVCLTGDVHHMSMETRDQAYLDGTEVEAAIEYAEIARKHDVPVTLFCTGKCVVEEPDRMARLAAMENVEIGGHNFWGFTTPVHLAWRALGKATGGRVGSWNGPRPFQAHEIRKTLSVFETIGVNVRSWRDHAYRHDANTASLLAEYGVTHLSDAVEPDGRVRRRDGATVVPITTPPDHEHVYHAFRTPEFVETDRFEGPFGSDSYSVEEWKDRICAHLSDDIATVLAHPACMKLADDFHAFESLCRDISDASTMSDISP